MSSNAAQSAALPIAAPPPPRGVEWIGVETAAIRLNVSARRVRQRCAGEWAPKGLARIDSVGCWVVREDADAGLSRIKRAGQIAFDWSKLTPTQRRELQGRKRLLDQWQAARAAGIRKGESEERTTQSFLAKLNVEAGEGEAISGRTLYRWSNAYRTQGLAGLVDGRWNERASAESDPFLAEVKRLYLLPKALKLTVCHTIATLKADENGWAVRSYKTCQRFIDRIPHGVLVKCREGAEAFVNQVEPYQSRDYTTLRSNEVWCSDHHPMDVMVIGPNGKPCRPWLTAWEDMRSRRIVGWIIFAHDPNSDTVLEAFRRGVMTCGVPENVYTDNGRDYSCMALDGRTRKVRVEHDSQRFAGVFSGLGVKKMQALPYHPQSKPIERFFGTVETRFGPLFDTYCGSSPEDKPEGLAERVKGGKAPTLADFVQAFSDWLEADYHQRPHFGDGMNGRTPAAVYAECLDVVRTASQGSLDVLCLRPSRPLRVTRNGVRFDGVLYGDLKLFEHLGKEVLLRVDDRDRSAVQVYTLDDRFICVAEMARKLPFIADSQQIREAHAAKGAVRRKTREYHESIRPRLADDLVDSMIRAAADKARQQTGEAPPPMPPVISPVRSSVEDQLPAIHRALKRDQTALAVGAESMSLTDLSGILRSQGGPGPAQPPPANDPLLELVARLRSKK